MTIPSQYAKTTLVIHMPNIWVNEWQVQYRNVMECHQTAIEQLVRSQLAAVRSRNVKVTERRITKMNSHSRILSPVLCADD